MFLKDLEENDWNCLKAKNSTWNEVDLRDNRYDQIIHLVNFNLTTLFNQLLGKFNYGIEIKAQNVINSF